MSDEERPEVPEVQEGTGAPEQEETEVMEEAAQEGAAQETAAAGTDSADMMSALKGMFSFFTVLPINIEQKEMDAMNREFWLVPIVGLLFGLLSVIVFACVEKLSTGLLACGLTIFAVEAFNRFLHFDGLIDVGDGLMVAGRREDHTRALKDTLVGAGGVATASVFILLMLCGITSLDPDVIAIGLVVCEILARFAQVVTAGFGKPSNGMAGESVRNTDMTSIAMSAVLTAVLVTISCVLMALMTKAAIDVWPTVGCYIGVALAALATFGWGWVMAKVAERNFGFVNGDVLGATNQTARLVVLLVIILVVSNV